MCIVMIKSLRSYYIKSLCIKKCLILMNIRIHSILPFINKIYHICVGNRNGIRTDIKLYHIYLIIYYSIYICMI